MLRFPVLLCIGVTLQSYIVLGSVSSLSSAILTMICVVSRNPVPAAV